MKNALSIDLEDWFCVHNLAGAIKREDWDKCDLRVRANTTRILDLLDQRKVRATFFILGWVADRAPELIREVEARGHEIGVHGYNHLLLTEITPEEFDEDLNKALEAIARAGVKWLSPRKIGRCRRSKNMVSVTTRQYFPWGFTLITALRTRR
jgi:peptidoglycan/xylan/chitin deacetylase (PgdA/CDA1 family)